VIPTIITQLLMGETRLHLGSLAPSRDFNYVGDTVRGFLALAEAEAAVGREVNIATGIEHTVGDVARMLITAINPTAALLEDENRLRPEASEVFRLIGDASLLTSMTGWRPQCTLGEGLARTVEWFREPDNLRRYKAWTYNL